MTIMNKICFDPQGKNPLDGNFISIYDEKDNRFHYFVHRLKGPFALTWSLMFFRNRNWKCKGASEREDVDLLHQQEKGGLGPFGWERREDHSQGPRGMEIREVLIQKSFILVNICLSL